MLAGTGLRWSGGLQDGLDALPGGGDRLCPGPGVGDLEQGQLGAGGPLPAGEDPHSLGPALELVAVRPLAQQPGQLGDVHFFYPAGPVRRTQKSAATCATTGRLRSCLCGQAVRAVPAASFGYRVSWYRNRPGQRSADHRTPRRARLGRRRCGPRRHLLPHSEREGGTTLSCYYSKSLLQYKP